MISLFHLTYDELCAILENGHIGAKMKEIVELTDFYDMVNGQKENIEKEIANNIPVDRYFKTEGEVSLVFKVTGGDLYSKEGLTHLLMIDGYNITDANHKISGYIFFNGYKLGYHAFTDIVMLVNDETGAKIIATEISEEEYNSSH